MTRAERIYNIFKKLHFNRHLSLMDGWQKVFKTDNVFDVYFYLERLYNEIELLENELNIPDKIYKPILDKCKVITKDCSFNTSIHNIGMSENQLATFYGFSFYGVDEKVIELDIDEDLEIMLNSLNEMENQEIKLILADIVSSFHRLKTLPLICGINSIESAFKELYCKTQINIDEIQKAPKAYKEALISAYQKTEKIISFFEKWSSRVENMAKLIENFGG